MTCLLSCLVWFHGIGYADLCPGAVEVIYATEKYNYVKFLQGPRVVGHEVDLEMKNWRQVDKKLCRKVAPKPLKGYRK